MERIRIFRVLKGLSRFFVIFGIIFTLLGMYLFVKSLMVGFNLRFPSGDWNSVFFIIQGLLFILMGYSNLKNKKYFIEWDRMEFRFLLPDTKKVESIRFSDIKSVSIKLFEVEFTLTDRVRTLNLENLDFEELRSVKKKIEEIKSTTAQTYNS